MRSETIPDVIGIREASFTWANDAHELQGFQNGRNKFALHIENDLIFQKGRINVILGPTASGKTSILMALLGKNAMECVLL